ncbi:hypothetical protein EPN28_01595 [Patescibacteria group bacterium]|nr:MAG: hypothetical protein EPN28_01595 [Patescibacteria group bacterium]
MKKIFFRKIFIYSLFALLLAVGLFFFSDFVFAQPAAPVDVGLEQAKASGLPDTDIRVLVAKIIRTALGLLGIVALVLLLYGGFAWMTAGGNDEKIATAKKIIFNALIGLVIILASYAITSFVISKLVSATGSYPQYCYNGVQDQDETGVDCGGSCAACGGGGPGGYLPGDVFYVAKLPGGGQLCLRNVHPTVAFNLEFGLSSIQGNIVLIKKSDNSEQAGDWKPANGSAKIAEFVPKGSCGASDPPSDCLEPSTAYILRFKNPSAVTTADGKKTLNCSYQLGDGCKDVEFITGDGVDRKPPTIYIQPPAPDQLQLGLKVPVYMNFADDLGVQNVTLKADGQEVGYRTFAGCQKSGTTQIDWPTAGLAAGNHTLNALDIDWAGQNGSDTLPVYLRPQHCFDNVLDPGEIQKGPPACGGECGACAGGQCAKDADCASGYCEIPSGQTTGVCVERAMIRSVSPGSGAPGSYVTIFGSYFGVKPGAAYMAAKSNPSPDVLSDWIKADLANCGSLNSSWSSSQILVEAPRTAVSGPMMVVTATNTINGAPRQFIDRTNDSFGPSVPDFSITTQTRPSLCPPIPPSGVVGQEVTLAGKSFSTYGAASKITFGELAAYADPLAWNDTAAKAKVPGLGQGWAPVKLTDTKGAESNSVGFAVIDGMGEGAPVISGISPENGGRGEYITITGKNFGDKVGKIWFKLNGSGLANLGDFDFPPECKNNIWKTDRIIVKFPNASELLNGQYAVQVVSASGEAGAPFYGFTLGDGRPAPGICNIDPTAGPVPFAASSQMKIAGEYFGASPSVYFWKTQASSTSVVGRVPAAGVSVANSGKAQIASFASPPPGAITGPVVVYRSAEQKMSNPANFDVYDCVKSGNKCAGADKCCATGADKGLCKPATELCAGETLTSGYVWRISTRDIPKFPRVIERCDDAGIVLPSPSPDISWDGGASGDHHNVCRQALVSVEFSKLMNPISPADFVLRECAGLENGLCVNPVGVPLADQTNATAVFTPAIGAQTANGATSFVNLKPTSGYNNGLWKNNTWYQAVLSANISAGVGPAVLNLQKDKPCDGAGIANSAYCFFFKTDDADCKMKKVLVTPYDYYTSVLEKPITNKGNSQYWSATGLSTQKCVLMDASAFNWSWNSGDTSYSEIFDGAATQKKARFSALTNTVGVGLANPFDAVSLIARAMDAEGSFSGNGILKIDLSDPKPIDFWPNCLEACTNAEVAVRWSTSMSMRNLTGANEKGSVKLYECLDENCKQLKSVGASGDVVLDSAGGYTILKVANSKDTSVELKPETLYLATVSASATNLSDQRLLWSLRTLSQANDATNFSKPYTKEFSWRFRTKKTKCEVARAEVAPAKYIAPTITSREVYNVLAYSSPDKCNPSGQKVNPWKTSWTWASSDDKVAQINFYGTQGKNQFCTSHCVKKGSGVAAGAGMLLAACGNGKVEAGEDCDLGIASNAANPQSAFACNLDCRSKNNTKKGSSASPPPGAINVSICGNRTVGDDEDCDLGIAPDPANPQSALGCNASCLHNGTKLASKWCWDNQATFGGFAQADFNAACAAAFSQCGDGIEGPEEDVSCDLGAGKRAEWCNDLCQVSTSTYKGADKSECTPGLEGCGKNGQHLGSSLLYTTPSVCADGKTETGEDDFCESGLSLEHKGLIDPWSLAIGKGLGTAAAPTGGGLPIQSTDISAAAGIAKGIGKFEIPCGYTKDSECPLNADALDKYGVGSDTCCYKRPAIITVYPGALTGIPQTDICPNTVIEAEFDKIIDNATLKNNFIIARGVKATEACPTDDEDVAALMPASTLAAKWCAGSNLAAATVIPSSTAEASRVYARLSAPLATSSPYAIILKNEIRDKTGVSIGYASPAADKKHINWKFSTATKICEVKKVEINPAFAYLSANGQKKTLEAIAKTDKDQIIQPIPNYYAWQYWWAPTSTSVNPYVILQNTTANFNEITAQNRNGEIDVTAAAEITSNKYTAQSGLTATGKSRVVVFLCENPWPATLTLPYEDKYGNNDNIPASAASGDGFFNFSTYYCADSGATGKADDLPYLKPAVQTTAAAIVTPGSLKRFFLASDRGPDAIGIQVFSNPGHLTPRQWYENDKASGGKGFVGQVRDISVNGYGAVTDDYNYYVDALSYANYKREDGTGPSKNLYSNIYLFSLNANASPEMKKVFSQLMENLRFNVNLTNSGFCGTSIASPGSDKTCVSDFDCPGGQVCSAQTDKLKRNYRRLRDLAAIEDVLEGGNKGLVGHYTLDKEDRSGKTIFDKSGYNYKGTAINNPVFSTGVLGQAMNFNGTSDYVDLGNPALFAGGNAARTLCSWGKTGSVSNDYGFIVAYGSPSAGGAFYLGRQGESLLGGGYSDDIKVDKFWTTGVWHHICLTYDGTLAKLYADGALLKSEAKNWNLTKQAARIGAQVGASAGQLWNGQIDDVRVYNRALTNKEVMDLMNSAAGKQSFPKLESGTYLAGQTVSAWPSWSVLGAAAGGALPVDPINKLAQGGSCTDMSQARFCTADTQCAGLNPATCTLHDPVTGWSVADRRFSFACHPNSLAYRYIYSDSGGYTVRSKFENPFDGDIGASISNWTKFVDDFVDKNRFKTSEPTGICLQYNGGGEITGLAQGSCGDGYVTAGKEACDPPGQKVYDKGACTVKTCESDCQWSAAAPVDCATFKNCGNNKLDFGEQCDDGKLNGTWNKCNTTCSGKVPAANSADLANYPGYCGDSVKNSKYEICDPGNAQAKYALKQTDSCAADCQKYGPYCGDNFLQVSDEQCDPPGSETTCVDGVKSVCDAICRYTVGVSCAAAAQTPAPAGSCGDKVVATGEACDEGAAKNGKPCAPSYGKSCSYCSVDCKNTIDVQPKEYCGDSLLNGPEKCETVGKTLYSAEYLAGATQMIKNSNFNGYAVYTCEEESVNTPEPGVYKVGQKTCSENCMKLTPSDDCVKCGLDNANGVEVGGEIINVLDPKSTNPLNGGATNGGFYTYIKTMTGEEKLISGRQWNQSSDIKYSLHEGWGNVPPAPLARIHSDPACKYQMNINSDIAARHRDFPIYSQKESETNPWHYDLILSPVIPKTTEPVTKARPNDVRIVTTWIGDRSFNSGFYGPGGVGKPPVEDNSVTPVKGAEYYINSDTYGIWYHGSGNTLAKSNELAFTVDASKITNGGDMVVTKNQLYSFYVRLPGESIKNFGASAKLKVDVYFPEAGAGSDSHYYRHFDLPDKTYYLSGAQLSANAKASYWQVFNVCVSLNNNVGVDNIRDINKIVTDKMYFDYSVCGATTASGFCKDKAGVECRGAVGECDVVEKCDSASEYCPGDSFKPSGAACIPAGGGSGKCDGYGACVSNAPSGPVCGNGKIEAGEECEGNVPAGQTCESRFGAGFTGNLTCNNCQIDSGQCKAPPPACTDECTPGSGYPKCRPRSGGGDYVVRCVTDADTDKCYEEFLGSSWCEYGCTNGQCVSACVPDCSGKDCGSNGCGGVCGSRGGGCDSGYECNRYGKCVQCQNACNFTGSRCAGKCVETCTWNNGCSVYSSCNPQCSRDFNCVETPDGPRCQ